MALKDNLKRLREEAGYTQAKAFSKVAGIPYSSYAPYERGAWPNEKNLIKIAKTLHVSIDELLGYSPSQSNELEKWLLFCKNNGFTVFRWKDSHVIIAYNPENQPVQIPDFTECPEFMFDVSDLTFITFDNEWFMEIVHKAVNSKEYIKAKDTLLAYTLQMTVFNYIFNLPNITLKHIKYDLAKKSYTAALNKIKHQKR